MNASGDLALFRRREEGDSRIALVTLRADGEATVTELAPTGGYRSIAALPNGRFLVGLVTVDPSAIGASSLVVRAGY